MRYLGGKSKIARQLAEIIGGGDLLIEPFVGGGAVTAVLAPRFNEVRAYDIHPDLILMWKDLQNGWEPPRTITEEQYAALKYAEPSALRGFAGFAGASWGGKWFGGYARGDERNYADEAARSLARDIKKLGNVVFTRADYRTLTPSPESVVYADPPYAGTTGYGECFDSKEFWVVMDSWANSGARVFVSEYSCPVNWQVVWQKLRTRDMKAHLTDAVKVTEKLFYRGPETK